MNRYIALLRAINVGGYRKIKMQDLRNMFVAMGFENVRTYIQSGNVIFDSDESEPTVLSQSVKQQIESEFGHDVPVMIRTLEQLNDLIENNPFDGMDVDPFRLYVTFFQEPPPKEKQQELKALSNSIEKFNFVQDELFSLVNKKTDQKVNFSNSYVEKIIGIPGTGRNWRSVNKIFEIASD